MIISELSLKNFKSFGNSPQILKLNTEKGELILLVGNNGNGKSSLISSFEFVLYGKCKGNKKKWATMSTLPNRINGGDTEVNIKFTSNKSEIEVIRGISPNKLTLIENGLDNDKAGKGNVNTKIEDYIGFDIETFKSFISMSINDFKNFISLKTEEKKILLDKLFNLEVINILAGILKNINSNNKNVMASLESEINTLDDSIDSIRKSIDKALVKEKENIQQEIDQLVSDAKSKKEDYLKLKEKVAKIKEKDQILQSELDKEKTQLINTKNDIRNVQKEINLYDSGKCPTCSTDFTSEHFLSLRETLVEKKEGFLKIEESIKDNIKKIREKETKLKEISEKTNTMFSDLSYLLKGYKKDIEILKSKQSTDDNSDKVVEFEETINELKDKKVKSSNKLDISKEKSLYYKELNEILSEKGVKKSIIAGIVKPINHFISENIKEMRLPFEVVLDEQFNAEIKSLGVPVEHDSLSTGETKKINIAILIAYLKLIRTKKHINILFLDEVFASIDVDGIDSILSLLKSFANEYNINIFVVHHAILSKDMFDRIINIEKDVFSSLNELDYEQN
jgi:DNA repair exonuclease SbcCD ATPase subunit